MKRIISILLIMALFFCGCSKQDEVDIPEETTVPEEPRRAEILYEKYEELILLLESGDYDSARTTIDLLRESNLNQSIENGDLEKVQLTRDNVFDYFEIVEITEWKTGYDAVRHGFITHVCIALKNEFDDRIVWDESAASFDWSAVCSVKNCTVDYDNKMISIENVFKGATTSFGAPETITGKTSLDTSMLNNNLFTDSCVIAEIGEIVIVGEYNFEGAKKPVCYDYDDPTITAAEGVLIFKNNSEDMEVAE